MTIYTFRKGAPKIFGPFKVGDQVSRAQKSKYSKNETSSHRDSPKLYLCKISDILDYLCLPYSALKVFGPFKVQDRVPWAQKLKFSKNEKKTPRNSLKL